MAGVAVAQEVGADDVTLARARGQTCAWTHTLNVPDDARNLGKVCQTYELGHEADAGARGCGHGACACPASAYNHTNRGQLILGLDHGVGRFLRFRIDAQLGAVAVNGLRQTGGRRNRIPGDELNTAVQRTQRRSRVTVGHDFVVVEAAHGRHAIGLLCSQRWPWSSRRPPLPY